MTALSRGPPQEMRSGFQRPGAETPPKPKVEAKPGLSAAEGANEAARIVEVGSIHAC